MTDKLKQKMTEEILKLPKENQVAINSIDWASGVSSIGTKYTLTENEIGDLQLETGLVLIGLYNLDEFTFNIENEISLGSATAEKIVVDIMERILTPIANNIQSSIEHNLEFKKTNWDQTVNFIVSGGDYSVFKDKKETLSETNHSNVKGI